MRDESRARYSQDYEMLPVFGGFCIHCSIIVFSAGYYMSKAVDICSDVNIYFNTLYPGCFCTSVRDTHCMMIGSPEQK